MEAKNSEERLSNDREGPESDVEELFDRLFSDEAVGESPVDMRAGQVVSPSFQSPAETGPGRLTRRPEFDGKTCQGDGTGPIRKITMLPREPSRIGLSGQEGSETDGNDKNESDSPAHSDGQGGSLIPDQVYDLLPHPLARVTSCFEDRRKRDVFLTVALPTWAGALPNVRLRYGGQSQSVNLFSVVVAPPASGKGAMRHARKMGNPLNEELIADSKARRSHWRNQGKDGPEPPYRRLFLPADTSSAKFKEDLKDNPQAVVFDTEILSYANAANKGWGGSRDAFLRGFQNEAIEVGRKSDDPIRIEHPAPSIAFSGTPGTLKQVISGTGDGLFSRFLFYRFEREMEWRSQFGNSTDKELISARDQAGQLLQETYYELSGRSEPLEVTIGPGLQDLLDETFTSLTRRWKEEGVAEAMRASLTRAGLQVVRIGAILSVIREAGTGQKGELEDRDSLSMNPADMEAGLRLVLTYLMHALRVQAGLEGNPDPHEALTEERRRYLEALPEGTFSTSTAKEAATEEGVNQRTAQRWLNKFVEMGLLLDIGHGNWKKPAPDMQGVQGVEAVVDVISDIPRLLSIL